MPGFGEERLDRMRRIEALGRLAGVVVHDVTSLPTNIPSHGGAVLASPHPDHPDSVDVEREPARGTSSPEHRPGTGIDDSPQPRPAATSRAANGETILLVEDDAMVRAVLRRDLRRRGFDVLEASSGAQALHLMEARGAAVDLVLTDLVMPTMSGRELVERIRERGWRPAVIVMTGYSDDFLVRHGGSLPDLVVVEKPFGVDALERRIRAVLDATRAARTTGSPS